MFYINNFKYVCLTNIKAKYFVFLISIKSLKVLKNYVNSVQSC